MWLVEMVCLPLIGQPACRVLTPACGAAPNVIPSAPTPVSDRSVQYLLLIPSSCVNRRHHTILSAIFRDPAPANVKWTEVEHLVTGVGGTVEEGHRSRVRFELNGVRANFHRLHPRKEARRYQVRHLRDFFAAAGVIP